MLTSENLGWVEWTGFWNFPLTIIQLISCRPKQFRSKFVYVKGRFVNYVNLKKKDSKSTFFENIPTRNSQDLSKSFLSNGNFSSDKSSKASFPIRKADYQWASFYSPHFVFHQSRKNFFLQRLNCWHSMNSQWRSIQSALIDIVVAGVKQAAVCNTNGTPCWNLFKLVTQSVNVEI